MAMSFRSLVKLSKAFSISEVSVFASTTRKFRCEEGGSVTCWSWVSLRLLDVGHDCKKSVVTNPDPGEEKTGDRVLCLEIVWLAARFGCVGQTMRAKECIPRRR